MSALGLAALAEAQKEIAAGVRGGRPGWGGFRGEAIDGYMSLVGLVPHADHLQEGWPWCAAGVYAMFERARLRRPIDIAPGVDYIPPPNPCPRTPGALHIWDTSPLASRRQLPAPGDVFVLDRGKGRGHVGFVVTVSPDGKTIGSLEPDTNPAGSSVGDQWGEHPLWQPTDGTRGVLKGYLEF